MYGTLMNLSNSLTQTFARNTVNHKIIKIFSLTLLFVGVAVAAPKMGTMTDSRDGKKYKTVKIGKQVWMAENLNYAYLQPTSTVDSSSWCYNDSAVYCEKYGRIYTWAAAMDSAGEFSTNGQGCGFGVICSPDYPVRGVCPEGWHLPELAEIKTLYKVAKTPSNLKMRGFEEHTTFENATNATGFSAIPVMEASLCDGSRCDIRRTVEFSKYRWAIFWTATEYKKAEFREESACILYLESMFFPDYDKENYKAVGHAVRCIKDSP